MRWTNLTSRSFFSLLHVRQGPQRRCHFSRELPRAICCCRSFSQKLTADKSTANVKGLVYVSTSTNVFANLSFEDWVYNNIDLSETSLMILWRNDPSVVIGRHQNPWAEVNLRQLWQSEVKLARRRSGGGTVYHDQGNLNITFFTSRDRYNRTWNLNLISGAIRRAWPHLSVSVNKRDDIVLDNFFKISGTSSKLGQNVAYHHCTLLHSVNTMALKKILEVDKAGLKSRATSSVKSSVKNLADAEPAVSHQSLVRCISDEYYNQLEPYRERELYEIDPTDVSMWKDITKFSDELKSWEWVYGKTPRFSVTETRGAITVIVHVHHATIEGVVIQAPPGWLHVDDVQRFTEHMKGQRFWSESVGESVSSYVAGLDASGEEVRKYRLLSSMIRDTAS